MNTQDKQEPDNQQSVTEGFAVNDAQAPELKGGLPSAPAYSIVIYQRPTL